MALPLSIPNCIQVRLLWALGTQGAVNVYTAQNSAAFSVDQAVANTIGAAIKASFGSTIAPQLATSTRLVRVGVRDIRTPHLTEFLDTGAAVAGTGTGDVLPNQAALCITMRTAKSGKSFRGRTYFSGYTEAANDVNGLALAAAVTGTLGFCTGIQNALAASSFFIAVGTRPQERVVTTQTTFHSDGTSTVRTLSTQTAKSGAATNVTAFESRNNQWETQRRRNNGRGAAPAAFGATQIVELTGVPSS